MSQYQNSYPTQEFLDNLSVKYLFISSGKDDIVKAIEYQYIEPYDKGHLYNLAFGDYDIEKDMINDLADTNNGDHYAVFNTILNTIPSFFYRNPSATMMVQGSDTKQEYIDKCKETCKRRCHYTCKKSEEE